ncbi:diglucosylglycerate octanoyltransferase [Williamsia sterculiae]|uniref:GDSL-like Lipase/Acylhydrolase family protein n=1 Tax=Williamsia sterculiae TaxID=1344003 RepID=A0A1N7G5Y7_9NOCA|nr:diglucosylglycerate octanoyltransferase [Williamsia sterculiae]SIS07846.1 GDSL-like Lipase/Acylhydrolase family protein [Williamsia sterculiae]
MTDRGALLVLSDSLAYYGPEGGLPADDPRIWPSLVADELDLDLELFGRIGWTTRDVWWALIQDPRIWSVIPRARLVVLAIAGMDTLPSPLPTALREDIRYIRPARLRQWVRAAYGRLQPLLSPVGWPIALPASATVDHLEKIRSSLAAVRPDLPVVMALPPTHRSPYYAGVHTARIPTTTAIRRWADTHRVPTVDFYPTTAHHFAEGDCNPDGIHWGFDCHRDIAGVVVGGVRDLVGSGSVDDPAGVRP